MKMKCGSSSRAGEFFTFTSGVRTATEKWFRLPLKRGICCACRAERGTGLICVKNGEFARSACFKIRADGRRTIPKAVSIADMSRCVSGRTIFRPGEFELRLPFLPKSSSIGCLLLDIEGTTSSVEFVYNTLFPFASAHVETFLHRHAADPEIKRLVSELRAEQAADAAQDPQLGVWMRGTAEEEIATAAKYVRHLIALDRKTTPLKTLQREILVEGFRSGE